MWAFKTVGRYLNTVWAILSVVLDWHSKQYKEDAAGMAPAASALEREVGTKRQRIERLIQRGDLLANAQQERQFEAPSGPRTSSSRKASSAQVFNAKRSSWTPQEDAKLCKLVQQLGSCNWSKIATHFPARDRKRCRERFVNHLAPSLAASRGWSAADDEKLLQLQRTLHSQWSKMARQFAGRSAESVKNRCLLLARRSEDRRPSSDSRNRAPAQRWTAAEKDKLRSLVETHGAKNWLFIASQLPGRTDLQCLQQWHRTLDGKVVKGKGTWTEKEDRLLVEKVEEIGRNWTQVVAVVWTALSSWVGGLMLVQIAAFLPGRVGSQCRERFLNHLDPTINSVSVFKHLKVLCGRFDGLEFDGDLRCDRPRGQQRKRPF